MGKENSESDRRGKTKDAHTNHSRAPKDRCPAIPSRFHSRRIDPATKTFQALRITTNVS